MASDPEKSHPPTPSRRRRSHPEDALRFGDWAALNPRWNAAFCIALLVGYGLIVRSFLHDALGFSGAGSTAAVVRGVLVGVAAIFAATLAVAINHRWWVRRRLRTVVVWGLFGLASAVFLATVPGRHGGKPGLLCTSWTCVLSATVVQLTLVLAMTIGAIVLALRARPISRLHRLMTFAARPSGRPCRTAVYSSQIGADRGIDYFFACMCGRVSKSMLTRSDAVEAALRHFPERVPEYETG